MRISDWSSDVCSSDLERRGRGRAADRHHRAALAAISRDARAYPVRPVSKRRDPNPTFDLFIPLMNDLPLKDQREVRSEEHTSELQSLMRSSYALLCLTTHNNKDTQRTIQLNTTNIQ